MDRAFYPSDAGDPDLDWLVSRFLWDHPDYIPVEISWSPFFLLPYREKPVTEQKCE